MVDQTDNHDAAADGVFGFVLAKANMSHGLSFWNNDAGFGPLFAATVFSEDEAGAYDVPIADDQPQWLALPAPLNLAP